MAESTAVVHDTVIVDSIIRLMGGGIGYIDFTNHNGLLLVNYVHGDSAFVTKRHIGKYPSHFQIVLLRDRGLIVRTNRFSIHPFAYIGGSYAAASQSGIPFTPLAGVGIAHFPYLLSANISLNSVNVSFLYIFSF